MTIFCRPLEHLHLRHTSDVGKRLKKVDCSIGLALVGAGAAFNKSGHSEVWGVQGGVDGHKIRFSLGTCFLVMSRRVDRRVFSLVWVALDERLTVVEENYLQGEGPVRTRQVLSDST